MFNRMCTPVVFVSVWLLTSAATAAAQGDGVFYGTVTARTNGSPVAGATVEIRGGSLALPLTATTADDGRFVFARLAPGDYDVDVVRATFTSRRYRLSLKPREVAALDVALDLGTVQESVQVTAEAPPSVHSPGSTLLTATRLEALPLAQRTSLPDAIITAAPGMIRGHDDFVHIRGHEVALNPSINGVQFWENAHAVFSPGLGVDYVESINVMTGGFPAEYGNRFGGILDVVTKSGLTLRDRGSIVLGFGSAQRHNAGAELGGQAGRLAYYLNVAGFTSDRFLSPPSPRSIHNTGRGVRSFGRIDVMPAASHRITVVAVGDGVGFELPMEERDTVLRPSFRNEQRARSQSLIVSWDRAFSSDSVLQTSFYQRWSSVQQRPETVDRYGAETDATRTLNTLGFKSDLTRIDGRHAVKAGFDLVMLRPREDLYYVSQPWIDFTHLPEVNETHVHLRGPNVGAGIPRPVSFSGRKTGGQASLFLQDRVQLSPAFTLDLGLRADRYSLAITESHLSPRLNAAYRLPAGTTVFGSYNHFFVPPPVENVLAGSAGLTALVSEIGRALPPLRAITEDQFEAGVRQPVGRAVNVAATGYYRTSVNPAHTSLFPDSRFYTYASFDRGEAYGAELKLDVPAISRLGLSGYLNYAVGRVWLFNPIHAGFTTEAAHLTGAGRLLAPMDQTHTVTSGITYQHSPSRLWGAVAMEYGSGTPGGHGGDDHADENGDAHEHASGPGLCATRCEPHFTQNVSIGWNAASASDAPRISVQVNVENVSNRIYLLSKESTMVQGQYSIPRLISASVRWRF